MPGQNKTLEDLFLENLKDIYYAERKILVALPKMAKAANSDQLRAAFAFFMPTRFASFIPQALREDHFLVR
jgi:hypothetical protein